MATLEERVSGIEARLDSMATKADLAEVRVLSRIMMGFVLIIVSTAVGVLTNHLLP